ncbi:chaperone modulator CbpM [Colwellia sp. 12G3]|uniref:chaperone modulator CbpM n=1 Tax=Colwellia sp. 12G3 TaxID=2058299 RepID=UPI000C32B32E|nr:chaperone modulator CbpM [Colwellia sp. 12G3]PKI18204.1 MerR family transcriptional regulator [Colwellia sp. 12G3]
MNKNICIGVVINEQTLTLEELCKACVVQTSWVITLVNEGILDPQGQTQSGWEFSGDCLQSIHTIKRLEADLGINIAGAALILELLDENQRLKRIIEDPINTVFKE